jgi:outer membrane protein W
MTATGLSEITSRQSSLPLAAVRSRLRKHDVRPLTARRSHSFAAERPPAVHISQQSGGLTHMRLRLLLLSLTVALFALPTFAQSELGVFVNSSSMHSTDFSDPDIEAKLKFDRKSGYGISYNHYVSPNVSLEISAQKIRGDANLDVTDALGGTKVSVGVGTLDLRQYDAALQWHFAPRGFIDPYIGGGVARIGGKLKGDDAAIPAGGTDLPVLRLDDKFTWLADAGVDLRVARSVAVTLAAKYTSYTSGVDAAPDDPVQELKLDPLTISLGVRFRF